MPCFALVCAMCSFELGMWRLWWSAWSGCGVPTPPGLAPPTPHGHWQASTIHPEHCTFHLICEPLKSRFDSWCSLLRCTALWIESFEGLFQRVKFATLVGSAGHVGWVQVGSAEQASDGLEAELCAQVEPVCRRFRIKLNVCRPQNLCGRLECTILSGNPVSIGLCVQCYLTDVC